MCKKYNKNSWHVKQLQQHKDLGLKRSVESLCFVFSLNVRFITGTVTVGSFYYVLEIRCGLFVVSLRCNLTAVLVLPQALRCPHLKHPTTLKLIHACLPLK